MVVVAVVVVAGGGGGGGGGGCDGVVCVCWFVGCVSCCMMCFHSMMMVNQKGME